MSAPEPSGPVLLDNCVFLQLARPGGQELKNLSVLARRVVSDANSDLRLSVVSLTEIAMKNAIGKLDIRPLEAMRVADDMGLTLLDYKPAHCLALHELPLHHKDPFDRMLIATASYEGFTLMSYDEVFGRYQQDGFLSLHLVPRWA